SGKIRILRKGKYVEFYLRSDPAEKSGKYMRKSDPEKIRIYTEKSYCEKITKLLDSEILALKDYIRRTGQLEDSLRRAYSDYPDEVKQYIDPVDVSDEDYVRKWISTDYRGKEIKEDSTVYETENGERVRSKSELTIANALAKRGIPYKYECPLILKNGLKIHPDFTVLNIKKRRQIYWEHRGMMDDPEYSKHSVDRIKQYMKSGIIIGRDLVITEETLSCPLGTDEIDSIIKTYFL
ncbi:MAG: hypothetical protein IK139_03705, partial [Lachnospiraceae bacterium]|nr:hypothetical protein [Lachnospiraceae bacterium]